MTPSKMVYDGNKPDCSHCGEPIEDSSPRVQRAGKVYHADNPPCQKAWTDAQGATSGPQVADTAEEDSQAGDSAPGELELSDEDLARVAVEMADEAERLGRMARAASFDLEARLIGRRATKFEGEHFRGTLRPQGFEHTIDDQERFMERLGPLLSRADQDRAFPPPPPPPPRDRGIDHRVLNDLRKLGGDVAAIIAEERRSAERRPRLKIERIETSEEDTT